MTDPRPEPLTAEDRELLKTLRKMSPARKRWLWRWLMAAHNGLTVEQARRVAGREPPA